MPGLAGTSLGRYHLQERLGRGGMSEVYLAYDEQEQRPVAIKVVGSTDADYLERFHREADAINSLNHAHILPALDYGEQGLWHYIVMPCIEHGTLRERLLQGPLSLEDAGLILEQIGSALQFAHDHGIIHRDIKPSNILLRNDRYAYLADFGLAKSLEGGSTITQSGNLLGTPEYMAPELAEGPATTSSDLYALGILLYQMVTGEVPFSAETPVAVYWKQIRDEPTPPSEINPAIPPAVEHVILRALEKQPFRRYQTAEELVQAYLTALTFPDRIEEEAMPVEAALATAMAPAPGALPAQEGKLLLPDSPVIAPSAIPPQPQRRRLVRRLVPNRLKRRSARLAPITPPPLEPLAPAASVEQDATVQGQDQVARLHPKRRGRSGRLQRRLRNPVLASLVAVGIAVGILLFIGLILAIPFVYFANQVNTQARLAIATANANATRTAQQAAHGTVTAQAQQAQVKATASIVLTATHGTVILQDPLSSNINGRWQENTSCFFSSSSYHVRVQQANFLQICSANTFAINNVTIQVDVTLLSGNNAGILFRAKGDQFYDFEITNQGGFFLRRHNSATGAANYTYLIQNTLNSAVAPIGQRNTLLVIANGDDFKLFINGTFVGEAQDGTYASGQIAFAAGTLPSTASGEASFANLKVFR